MLTPRERVWSFEETNIHNLDVLVFMWAEFGIEFRVAKYVTASFKPSKDWSGWINEFCFVEHATSASNTIRRLRMKFPFLPNRIPVMQPRYFGETEVAGITEDQLAPKFKVQPAEKEIPVKRKEFKPEDFLPKFVVEPANPKPKK